MSAWKYRYLVESASWSTTYILITNLQMLSQSEIAMTPHSRYRQALSAVSSQGQRPDYISQLTYLGKGHIHCQKHEYFVQLRGTSADIE